MSQKHQSRVIRAAPFWPSSPSCIDASALEILQATFGFIDLVLPEQGEVPSPKPHPSLPYLAGDEKGQLDLFSHLVNQHNLDLLWAVRGGYGALRWVPRIVGLLEELPRLPTVLGFSDVSFLHIAMFNAGLTTIHGPMLNTLKITSKDALKALGHALEKGAFPALKGRPYRGGTIRGRLLPVNLSCLVAALKTPLEPDLESSPTILALEDHNEPLYRLDRLFTQLREAGLLKKACGLAIGEIILPRRDEQERLIYLLDEILGPLSCPVVLGLPFGHGPNNMPLLAGSLYLLDGDSGTLMKL